jgi:hypothetical protein
VIVALLGLMAVSAASADELSIVGHGFSKHLDNHNFNEKNYGGALRYDKNDFGLQIGGYRNSINKNSFYAGIDWNPIQFKSDSCLRAEMGVFYGFATGYKFDITPIAGLQAAVKCDNVFVRVRAIPDPYYNSKVAGSVEFGLVVKRF